MVAKKKEAAGSLCVCVSMYNSSNVKSWRLLSSLPPLFHLLLHCHFFSLPFHFHFCTVNFDLFHHNDDIDVRTTLQRDNSTFCASFAKSSLFLFLLSKNRPEKGVLFPLERTTTQLDLLAVKQTPMSFFLLKYFYFQKTKSTFVF